MKTILLSLFLVSTSFSFGGGCLVADIIIFLDRSGSCNAHRFEETIAAFDLIESFELDPNGVRFGIVSFEDSSRAKIQHDLSYDKESLLARLQYLGVRKASSTDTRIESAFIKASDMFDQSIFERGRRPRRIIIIISDGELKKSHFGVELSRRIQESHSVRVLAVQVGDHPDQTAMKAIATEGFFFETNYKNLSKFLREIDPCM